LVNIQNNNINWWFIYNFLGYILGEAPRHWLQQVECDVVSLDPFYYHELHFLQAPEFQLQNKMDNIIIIMAEMAVFNIAGDEGDAYGL